LGHCKKIEVAVVALVVVVVVVVAAVVAAAAAKCTALPGESVTGFKSWRDSHTTWLSREAKNKTKYKKRNNEEYRLSACDTVQFGGYVRTFGKSVLLPFSR
jgi:hypothetical protein